ncbi:MAG: glycoside hydrolase family 16 protein [Chitinophagaceae bacterium]|nr:glycoside hydrolase family 16 protein [Chitinophagaceae bacterium]
MYRKSIWNLILPVLLPVAMMSEGCKSGAIDKTTETGELSFTVSASKSITNSGNFTVSEDGNSLLKTAEPGWLTFDIEVPAPGRYRVSLDAEATGAAPVACWIEDYIDNKDGRSFNITGEILASKTGTSLIDGSPLNKGVHKIKLHAGEGSLTVKNIKFFLFKVHTPTPVTLTQATSGTQWNLVWSDEFNGSGLPDSTKWSYDVGNWGWGNNELQYYTESRVENARQEDGNLIIEARKNDNGMKWSSTRLTTRGKQTFLYGKIEFRAKVPTGRGTWSAGWLLGDEYVDELSWPYCGEVDILENVGYEMDSINGDGKTHASIHCGAYYFKLNNQPTSIKDVKNMNGEFHTYTAEWTPEKIDILVDGVKYFEYNDHSSALAWPYNKAQNIIINLAMGGGWGGAKGVDQTLTSQKYIIDYVRVYEKK